MIEFSNELKTTIRRPIAAFVAVVACCVLPAVAIGQVVGGAVLLKNDRVMIGEITLNGGFYTVTIADQSRVSLPVEQVRFVGRDSAACYDHKTAAIQRWSTGDHFQLTRWCLLNDLPDQAVKHYEHVAKTHGQHPRVKQLALEIKKNLLEQPGFRDYLGLPEEQAVRSANGIASANSSASGNGGSANSQVVTASVGLANTAMHPQIASHFSRKIQPILLNRCSQAACHGVRGPSDYRLLEPYAREFARISSENLASTLKYVPTDTQEISPLLKYATMPHGIQKDAGLSLTETGLIGELRAWIQFVQNPVVSADASRVDPAQVTNSGLTQFVPYSPAVALTPVAPGQSGLRPVPTGANPATDVFPGGDIPSDSEIDALDRELRQMLGEAASDDPFDPAEFNRQPN